MIFLNYTTHTMLCENEGEGVFPTCKTLRVDLYDTGLNLGRFGWEIGLHIYLFTAADVLLKCNNLVPAVLSIA